MQKEKGIAYCGLACCICSGNQTCVGCRNDGCKDKEWCKNYRCCKEKQLKGCYECPDFPCKCNMLDKVRIRAFSRFISIYGEEKLIECLEINEINGIVYHYKNQLIGDYDTKKTEEEIINMILHGK